jgi:hypothetical protein
MAERPTGIAGAQDYQPANSTAQHCFICGRPLENHTGPGLAARAIKGKGVVQVCSVACQEDPRFRDA